ncbi:MAG: CBS domain-containing protein [Phycisphaerales bacterium]|jgi:acetoin utilization protein AcuB
MKISDIMTRQIVTASMDDDLEHLRELFTNYRFRHLPVIGDDGRLAGIVSDRDVLAAVSPFAGTINERTADANSLKRRAHQIMSRKLHTISPDETAENATLMLLHRRISALPVVDDRGHLVGVVTMRDLMRWLLNHAAIDPREGAA